MRCSLEFAENKLCVQNGSPSKLNKNANVIKTACNTAKNMTYRKSFHGHKNARCIKTVICNLILFDCLSRLLVLNRY